jgi:hypothetical protein
MKWASLILMALLGLASSCGPTLIEGRKIDPSKLKEVIKGQTKSEVVVQNLGQPERIEKMPSGEEKYVYRYYKEEYTHWWTLPRYEKQEAEIVVNDGVVQDYRYSRELRDVVTDEDK